MDIGPGDWVECIAPVGLRSPVQPEVIGGNIYQVEGIEPHARCGRCKTFDHPGLHLVNVPRWPAGHAGCHFRPIYRPKQSIIEALKAPSEREKEPA